LVSTSAEAQTLWAVAPSLVWHLVMETPLAFQHLHLLPRGPKRPLRYLQPAAQPNIVRVSAGAS
jgi:hypothetical protein